MKLQANGTFDVTLAPLSLHDAISDPLLGRMSISKQFSGDLAGSSVGEMLSARTAVPASAGYVAIEFVSGTLAGRSGSFVLQHSSTLAQGEVVQSIQVVPDSGTDGLTGLSGNMTIDNSDGTHRYTFDYLLP